MGRNGVSLSCLVHFFQNWDLVSTSSGSGRCGHVSWGFRAATGAAGKLELQGSVAGKLPVPAVLPQRCRPVRWPLHAASHGRPAAALLALLVLRQCGAWLKINAAIRSHLLRECSWPGEPRWESYMLAVARSWGCLLCRRAGQPGSWLRAYDELQSTTFSTGAWAAGLGALLLQTDHIQEPSRSHGLMGGRSRGFTPCEEQSSHLPAPAAEAGAIRHSRDTCPSC